MDLQRPPDGQETCVRVPQPEGSRDQLARCLSSLHSAVLRVGGGAGLFGHARRFRQDLDQEHSDGIQSTL